MSSVQQKNAQAYKKKKGKYGKTKKKYKTTEPVPEKIQMTLNRLKHYFKNPQGTEISLENSKKHYL